MLSHSAYDVLNQPSIRMPLSRPANSAEAKARLEEGNAAFRRWVADAYTSRCGNQEANATECRALLEAIIPVGQLPAQTPFAAVVGCSDARVPVRFLLGQSVNDIFEVRTAGQALGDECIGSLEYALGHLKTIKTLVVMGHSGCGAVTATVDAFLGQGTKPVLESTGLQAIVNRIIPSVILADDTLKESPVTRPGHADYRRHLIALSTTLNAASGALRLKQIVDVYQRSEVSVLYGVYDIATQAVVRHLQFNSNSLEECIGLAVAPEQEIDLEAIAQRCIDTGREVSSIG